MTQSNDYVRRCIFANGPGLPQHWQAFLEQNPHAFDVRQFGFTVLLDFEDGSHVQFKHAYAVTDRWRNQVLVMTEHCGYHVFNLTALRIQMTSSTPTYDAVRKSYKLPTFGSQEEHDH